MNRSRARELLPIIQAFAEGKDIQVSRCDNGSDWHEDPASDPNFDIDSRVWRIKPEPEVIWVNKYKDGDLYLHGKEERALETSNGYENNYEYIAKKFIAAE